MKLRILAFACGVFLGAHPAAAQTATASADPVSGTWTGSMARDGDGVPLTITLKFDGSSMTGTVTGPPSPGIIRKGTFDKASGALKFEVEVQDTSKTLVTFEGKVVNDKATGSVMMGGQTGKFSLTRDAGGAAAAAPPPAGGMSTGEALQKSFAEVSAYVIKSAEMIAAEKYTYQPTKSVRTVGQLIAHIADGYNYSCAVAAGKKVQWSDAIEKGNTDKASIVAKLKEMTDACNVAYKGGGGIPR
jgi:hypothetical protein